MGKHPSKIAKQRLRQMNTMFSVGKDVDHLRKTSFRSYLQHGRRMSKVSKTTRRHPSRCSKQAEIAFATRLMSGLKILLDNQHRTK